MSSSAQSGGSALNAMIKIVEVPVPQPKVEPSLRGDKLEGDPDGLD